MRSKNFDCNSQMKRSLGRPRCNCEGRSSEQHSSVTVLFEHGNEPCKTVPNSCICSSGDDSDYDHDYGNNNNNNNNNKSVAPVVVIE